MKNLIKFCSALDRPSPPFKDSYIHLQRTIYENIHEDIPGKVRVRGAAFTRIFRNFTFKILMDTWCLHSFYRAPNSKDRAACHISGIADTLALLQRPHGQNPTTRMYLALMLCQTCSASSDFTASLMLIHKRPAEAYPGLNGRHLEQLGSCAFFWFPNNVNKPDSPTIRKAPWKNAHINAKLWARRAGRRPPWFYPSHSSEGWADHRWQS